MLELLTAIVAIFDAATAIFAITKYWRVSFSILIATSIVVVLCVLMKSPAIRLILGMHIFIAILTVGLKWESCRSRLK